MYGDAEGGPANWIAWSFGLLLIAIMLIVAGYMFVMYLKSQHQKNQLDEQRRTEEQKAFRERLTATNQTFSTISGLNTESVREKSSEKSSEKMENPQSSQMDDFSTRGSGEVIGEKPVDNAQTVNVKSVEANLTQAPIKLGSKEQTTDEISSKKSLTDLKPIPQMADQSEKTAIIGGDPSAEIKPKSPILAPPVEKQNLSAEKAPGSSIGSDVSTYVISSQRSEMNNYNMLEAGRTPPTVSDHLLHRTSSIESFVPTTAVPSTIGTPPTVVPAVKQSSETYVSMPTPPNKK